MNRHEAKSRFGLTHREWFLGETISVEEWCDTYQPKGICFRDYPLPEPTGKAGEAGYGAEGLAFIGQNAYSDSVGEEGRE